MGRIDYRTVEATMLHALKRLFTAAGNPLFSGARDWAEARGHAFKLAREGQGFVIEGRGALTWRLEWGPSQRPYIEGAELRLRGETAEVELQMLVLSRQLMDAMERSVFEQYTEDLQTRIDTASPEEMRWLVLFQKAPDSQLGILRDSFGAAASSAKWLQRWMDGALSQQLQEARMSWLSPADPMALVFQRGRLALRLGLPEPDADRLTHALALFEVALREAQRVAARCKSGGGAPASEWQAPADFPPSAQ
jgi:hypothetical protein